jgi:hypothetical protein
MIKCLNKADQDTVEINNISEEDWLKHYRSFWFNLKEVLNNSPRERHVCMHPIVFEEMNEIFKIFKNRKGLGSDKLNMELLTYASITAKLRFLNICWTTYQIPDDCKNAITPIFKKGSRTGCKNYRGITSLNCGYNILCKNYK